MDEEEELRNILIGQQEAFDATKLIPGSAGLMDDIDRIIGAPRQIGTTPGGMPIVGSPGGFRGDSGFAPEEGKNIFPNVPNELAPNINIGNALMGVGGLPASAFGQAPAVNPFSMEAAGQVNPMMQQQSLEAPAQPQVTFRDYDVPEPPRAGALSVFAPSGDLKPNIDVNAITPSPTNLPAPSDVNTALNREVPVGSPSVQDSFNESAVGSKRPRPGEGGQDALRDFISSFEFTGRRGRRTSNGSVTQDPAGSVVGSPNVTPPIESPARPSINGIAPEITGRLPRSGDSEVTPRPELPSISPEFTPGPRPTLPDFIQDRQDRTGVRSPEISSSALPDILNSRSDRGREGLSQADARDLAQGLDPNASESQRMRALQIQSRLGLGQFKPERELSELEQREIESRIRSREADISQGERKGQFQPRLIDVSGESVIELSPGYFQRIPKDTPNKTGLQKTLENLQSDLDSGRLTQEEYDIATKNARDLYIGREKPKPAEPEETSGLIDMGGEDPGATPIKEGDATGFTPEQELNIQKVISANPGSKRADVIEAMRKAGKL